MRASLAALSLAGYSASNPVTSPLCSLTTP